MMRKKHFRVVLAVTVVALLGLLLWGPVYERVHPRAGWPKGVTLGSASVGGVYFIWAGGWGQIITDVVRVPASVEVTGGPVHNIRLVQAKEAHFGFATNAPLYEGWHGQGWAAGTRHADIRAIFPMYSSGVHWYALAGSGITTTAQLAGRRVGVGPVGGTPATYFPLFLEALGIRPSATVNAGFTDLTSQMRDGLLDAIGWIGGIPMPALMELEATHRVNIFGFTDPEVATITARYPFFAPHTIKAGTYRSLTTDIRGLAVWNMAITHKDMDEDLVYAVVRATFANLDRLIAVHPTAREVSLNNVPLSVIPYHPGAVRYFRERGITVPTHLLPPPPSPR
jgi:TRAP transporter TAXI family solute receptor